MQGNIEVTDRDLYTLRALVHPLLPEHLLKAGEDLITRVSCASDKHTWGDWEQIGVAVYQAKCQAPNCAGLKLNYIESNACAELFEKYPGLGKSVKEVTNA